MLGFGSVLQQYRTAVGVSQEELAERAGLSRRGISDLERGARRSPQLGTVRRLVQALELDSEGQSALLAAARHQLQPSAPPPLLRPSSLPLSLTSFVGRQEAVADVCTLLRTARLVTLIGPGGVGKTRLALEVARTLAQVDLSVAFVELAQIRDPALVPQLVAASLGMREQRDGDTVDALTDALAPRSSFLVLDNCEHVLQASAMLVERLLRACPQLRILTTSREGLAIPGESLWRVQPLASMDPGDMPPFDELARCAAVQLFLDRASAVDSRCVLTEENAPVVAKICHKLDGIPLAIELAAARTNVLSVNQIAHRLDDRLRLLTSTSRSAPERQRTLRATLEWSYDLLADEEKRLFARLAVFAGGWTLEACEVVCSDGSVARDDVLDLLGRLVDKSLILVSDDGPDRRYRMLEVVREYAHECLERSGEGDALRSAHAAVFVALAEAAAPQLASANELQWLQRLDVEYPNFRAAITCLLARGDIPSVLRLARALASFGSIRGRFREQRRWWDTCLEQCDAESPLRSIAAVVAGAVAYTQGDYASAFPLLDESLARARRQKNKPLLARASLQLAFASPLRGDPRVAVELFTEAEALFRELGQRALAANALIGLGQTARLFGDYDQAEHYFERSLADARDCENPGAISQALQCLGSVAILRGDLGRGKAHLREAVPIFAALENGMCLGYCALHLAQIALAEGDGRRAARLLGAADGMWRSDNTAIYPTYREMWRHACDAAATSLGERLFVSIFADRQSLTFEDVAAFAILDSELPGFTREVPAPASDGLTRREREIVALLAAGLSNREIGDRLVISEGTTEVHVKHILSKLGFKSRTQVATWFSRREPVRDLAARGEPA